MHTKTSQSGIAWVEVLVIAAIVVLLASFVVRLRYGQALLAAEYSFVQSLGISRDAYDIGKLTVFCIALLGYVVYRFTRRRRHL